MWYLFHLHLQAIRLAGYHRYIELQLVLINLYFIHSGIMSSSGNSVVIDKTITTSVQFYPFMGNFIQQELKTNQSSIFFKPNTFAFANHKCREQ